jgi:tetratricopeptide (TPR) repeat protein
VGYGDSDEFLTVGKTWGLAHPPGYTLYTTALHFAMQLQIPLTNETQRAHLVSGILSAIGLYYMTLTLFILTKENKEKKYPEQQFFRNIAVFTTIISVATAKLMWTYSQIAEKYLLSSTLISILMYLSILIKTSKKHNLIYYLSLSFVFGLLISHHQSTVFLLPFLVYIYYENKAYKSFKTIIISIIIFVIGFLIPQGLLIARSNQSLQASWYIHPGFQGLTDFISRADFRGNLYYTNTVSSGYFPNKITISQVLSGSKNYFQTILSSFSWWILLPILIGLMTLWKKERKLLIYISLPTVLIGFGLASYLSWPNDLGSQAATVRFYIPSFITFAPLICIGLYELMRRLYASITLLGGKKNTQFLVAIAMLLIPMIIAGFNFNTISLKKFDLISRLYKTIINQVEPNSIITCYSDSSCFALLYEQTVHGLRKDVDIVPLAYPLVKQKMDKNALSKFNYVNNPYLMFDIVTWNMGKRPVYAVDISKYYYDLFGIDNGFMFYIPQGYVGKLDRTMPTSFPTYDMSLSDIYSSSLISESDLMQRFLVQSLSQTHMTNAYSYLKIGDRSTAQIELNRGVNLVFNLTDIEKKAGLDTRTQIERVLQNPKFAPGSSVMTSDKILSYVPEYLKQNKYSVALILIRGAISVDPTNIQARLELARLYDKLGDKTFSLIEYSNILVLDPQNQEANDHFKIK